MFCKEFTFLISVGVVIPIQMMVFICQSKSGTQTPSYTVVDCRGLVKTLVSGVKTITWGIASCKSPAMGKYSYSTLLCSVNCEQLHSIIMFESALLICSGSTGC